MDTELNCDVILEVDGFQESMDKAKDLKRKQPKQVEEDKKNGRDNITAD
jgi:hypothetical protein